MSREPDDLRRIRADLAKARQRLAQARATAPAESSWGAATTTKLPLPNGALAWRNQCLAREADIARLELEYVMAMVPVWGAARIIEALEPAPPQIGYE